MSNFCNISFDEGFFTQIAQKLYDPRLHGGLVIINALSWNGRNAILEEIAQAQSKFKKAPYHEGPVMQDMFVLYCGEADKNCAEEEFPTIQLLRSEYLPWTEKVGAHASFKPSINSVGVHYYPRDSQGISTHQDYSSDKNLISIFILKGNDPLYLCRDRNKKDALPLEASPGDLILLRAPRNDAEKPLRPFHYLEKTKEERMTLIFRQRQK